MNDHSRSIDIRIHGIRQDYLDNANENWGSGKRRQHDRHPNEEPTTLPTSKTLCPPPHSSQQKQTRKEKHNTHKQFRKTHLKVEDE